MIVFGGKSIIGCYQVLFLKKLFSIIKKYLLLLDEKHSGFQKYIPAMEAILNLKKYIGFQKYIPVSYNKNFNFEGIHWFSEIYTCSKQSNILVVEYILCA